MAEYPMSADAMTDLKVTDPVCGMTFPQNQAAGRAEFGGKTWYFCSKGCLAKFQANPERFMGKDSEETRTHTGHSCCTPHGSAPHVHGHGHGGKSESTRAEAQTIYTCPMHPEIRQHGPGRCPICKMNLVPAKDEGGSTHAH